MLRNVLINSYINNFIFVTSTPCSKIAVNHCYFGFFLYLHSKFEREITNLISNFLMSISTSHYVQTFAKFLTLYYFKIYNLQTGSLRQI